MYKGLLAVFIENIVAIIVNEYVVLYVVEVGSSVGKCGEPWLRPVATGAKGHARNMPQAVSISFDESIFPRLADVFP